MGDMFRILIAAPHRQYLLRKEYLHQIEHQLIQDVQVQRLVTQRKAQYPQWERVKEVQLLRQ